MTKPTTPPVEPAAPVTPPAAPATPPAAPPVTPPVEPPAAAPLPGEPEGYVKTERYTGAVQKIQTLTASQVELQTQLTEKASAMELLNSSLAEAEAAGKTSLGEKDSKITELQGKLDLANTENSSLKALKMKIDAVKEMGRPDLLPIVEHLPDTTDPEQLKAGLASFAETMDGALEAQQQRLLSGVIDTPVIPDAAVPQTAEAWVKHIDSLPLGSPEKMDALDAYGVWLQNQGAV